ncbi:uncharacterized protein LOC127254916 [Andrographis paniculata]|uniref:uncharacterized protein LOC127254916 n=1 Tax=Andrographis paniculata TaxID=175694 RepID=UPI0021E706AA|nr:uncharacterized protein LOC127254916 [Andrographis paniculata]
MKFFSELGSCCGSAAATPETEAANRGSQAVDRSRAGGERRRLARSRSSGSTAAPWVPKLSAISEDFPMTSAHRTDADQLNAGDDERKRLVKSKSKPKAVIAPMFGQGDDYWKSTPALPAFSPMWYGF